jgi:hypothetical protein
MSKLGAQRGQGDGVDVGQTDKPALLCEQDGGGAADAPWRRR